MTTLVLVHGGGFDHRCWDLLVPELDSPAIAVDLPGRGDRPADLRAVTIDDCARAVAEAADGLDDVVLVGHSLAGVSLPPAASLLGDRVRHTVFVACTVPEHGTSVVDTLEPELQAMARAGAEDLGPMDAALAAALFGNDLDEAQLDWMVRRMVPEAPRLVLDPVDLSGLRGPRTWIRTLHDAVVSPEKQQRFAGIAGAEVVDLDAAHMCMISRPAELARLLDGIAAAAR